MAKRHPLLERAQLEAAVRYDPQIQDLQAQIDAIHGALGKGIHQERDLAKVSQQGNREQIPKVRRAYQSADATRNAAQAQLAGDLSSLGSAAAPFAGAAAVERAGAVARSAESRAGAVTEFRQRIAEAPAAAAAAIRVLRSNAASDTAKAQAKLTLFHSLKGAFTISQLDKFVTERQHMKLTKRGQNLSHQDRIAAMQLRAIEGQKGRRTARRGQDLAHQDRVRAARAKARAKKHGGLPPASSAKVHSQIGYAAGWFHRLDGHAPRGQIYGFLRTGQSVKDPKGNHITIKAVDPLFVNAGADLYYNGYLSRPNRVGLERLGFKVPGSWKRHTNPTARMR